MSNANKNTTQLPGAVGVGDGGGIVRLDDVTNTQGRTIPNATPRNSGVMTKEQAAKLEALAPGGGIGGAVSSSHIPFASGADTLADSGWSWDDAGKILHAGAPGFKIDGDGLIITGGTNPVAIGASQGTAMGISATAASPNAGDGALSLGITARRFETGLFWWHDTKLGAQLVAAATIEPTTGLHHVLGATQIDTIDPANVPADTNVTLTLIADGGPITISAAGNVATAIVIAQDKAAILVWDSNAAKWYVVQGG